MIKTIIKEAVKAELLKSAGITDINLPLLGSTLIGAYLGAMPGITRYSFGESDDDKSTALATAVLGGLLGGGAGYGLYHLLGENIRKHPEYYRPISIPVFDVTNKPL